MGGAFVIGYAADPHPGGTPLNQAGILQQLVIQVWTNDLVFVAKGF